MEPTVLLSWYRVGQSGFSGRQRTGRGEFGRYVAPHEQFLTSPDSSFLFSRWHVHTFRSKVLCNDLGTEPLPVVDFWWAERWLEALRTCVCNHRIASAPYVVARLGLATH